MEKRGEEPRGHCDFWDAGSKTALAPCTEQAILNVVHISELQVVIQCCCVYPRPKGSGVVMLESTPSFTLSCCRDLQPSTREPLRS